MGVKFWFSFHCMLFYRFGRHYECEDGRCWQSGWTWFAVSVYIHLCQFMRIRSNENVFSEYVTVKYDMCNLCKLTTPSMFVNWNLSLRPTLTLNHYWFTIYFLCWFSHGMTEVIEVSQNMVHCSELETYAHILHQPGSTIPAYTSRAKIRISVSILQL